MSSSFVDQVQSGNLTPEEMERAQHMYEDILLQTDSSRVAGRIARTYAESLLDVAEKRGEADAIGEEFRSLGKDVFPNIPGLEGYLASPAVNSERKDEAIARMFEGRATPLFVDFLRLLNRKDRLGLLRLIAIAYRTIRDNRANRIRVLVETASPLTEDQQNELRKTIADTIGKSVVLVIREHPELIGGMIVHVGDRIFDTSLRTKLLTHRNHLLARVAHEIQSRRDRFSHN